MISYLLITIGFIWLIFASIFDIKTREIPDWLNYSLIAIGLGIRFMYSFFDNYWFFLYGLIGIVIAFILGSMMYYGRQLGGGDVKLLMGMGAMYGSNPGLGSFDLPFFLVLIINIFIAGAVTGILYAFILGVRNRKKFIRELRRLDFKFLYITLMLIVLLILFGLFNNNLIVMIAFGVFLLFFVSLFGFMKAIERCCMHKVVNVNKLTIGDLLVKDIVHNRKIVISYKKPGITKNDIERLRRLSIKRILIKEGIPFAPNFLIGFLITIFYGSLLPLLW